MNVEEIKQWRNRSDFTRSQIISGITGIDNLIGVQLSSRFTFNSEDEKNFHKIFFESSFVSFNTRIKMYRKFLKIYIPNIINEPELKKVFGYLTDFQTIRNLFAHSMNPTNMELEPFAFDAFPYVRVRTYEGSELIAHDFTKEETEEFSDKLMKLKGLVETINAVLLSQVSTLKEQIRSEE